MHVKTIKQTKEWRFGIEYFHSEIGDIFYIEPTVGFAMLSAGVAIRAPYDEIPQTPVITERTPGASHCVFKCILADLAKKGTP